jgi:tetratricopeptide (TPR) repeat protein
VRQLQPSTPTLHRNLGLVLLVGTPDYKEARAVLEEGLTNDPENVEVYLALDGVLSAMEAAPSDRIAALRRFAAPDRLPSAMVFKLGLALAESGDAPAAEQVFHDRFFPREEGGTNVRAVYALTRLVSARAAAAKGDCQTALGILDGLPAAHQDLPFTRGTLADALQNAPMTRVVAIVEGLCGRDAAARERWERLERASAGGATDLAIADEARRRLGHDRAADQQRRLEAALQSATLTLQSGSTSSPGSLEYGRALLLAVLGRKEEARRSLQQVCLYPDRNLSHALAREAMTTLRE